MPLKLQLLLQKGHRDEQASRAVQEVLTDLGIRPTAAGEVTVSAEIDAPDFERLFGRKPEEPDTPRDIGALGFRGEPSAAELPIPDRLRDYVANITVAPEYIRMSPADGGEK